MAGEPNTGSQGIVDWLTDYISMGAGGEGTGKFVKLDADEFRVLCEKLGVPDANIDVAFDHLDLNGDGKLGRWEQTEMWWYMMPTIQDLLGIASELRDAEYDLVG